MNILIDFLFGTNDPNVHKAIAPLALAAIAAAPGIIKSVGSMFGSGQRQRAQKAANLELGQRKQAYESFQFTNPYANLENTFEDLKVSTAAADFQAQQEQQGLAQTLEALKSGGGGMGAAALAQALAKQQASNLQAASASISQQEKEIEMMKAREASRLQQLEAAGAAQQQEFELGRTETLLGMSAEEKLRADYARQQAKQDLIGGVSEAVGAFAGSYVGSGGGTGKMYKKSFKTMGNTDFGKIQAPPVSGLITNNRNPFTSND